jgi:hypothetical protein
MDGRKGEGSITLPARDSQTYDKVYQVSLYMPQNATTPMPKLLHILHVSSHMSFYAMLDSAWTALSADNCEILRLHTTTKLTVIIILLLINEMSSVFYMYFSSADQHCVRI